MQRVAKPGARILILEFGKPENPAWRAIYFTYLKLFVPVLGRLFCGSASAYAYILESLRNYPGQHGIAKHMRELNLASAGQDHLFLRRGHDHQLRGETPLLNGAVRFALRERFPRILGRLRRSCR